MGDGLSVKNRVGRTERDPWSAVTGSRPDNYQIPEVGFTLIEKVDHALFERKLHRAISTGVILQRWAERDPHFHCKAPAVMASVYAVCGIRAEAESQLVLAKQRILPDCADCKAQYLKRSGTYYLHESRYRDAHAAYSRAGDVFLDLGNYREAGQSILNRGVCAYIMRRFDESLRDQERALELLGDELSIYVIMATINIAAAYTELGQIELALRQIGIAQEMLKGRSTERPRLILRWIRALLLEAQRDLKDAGEMLDRVETRMRRLDMKQEHRVLLADRARIARRPDVIQAIARKAYAMEDIPRVQAVIGKVIEKPTHENIVAWRDALVSYVPPFPSTA